MPDTSIVIVTYNSGAEIGECLDAALKTGAELVVVDNASTDDTASQVRSRGVPIITNATNLGFAAAVNQGFRALTSSCVLLLNPDAVLRTAIEPLRRQCLLPGTGAAGGKLLDSFGRPQTGWMVRRLPTAMAFCFELLLVNRLWPNNPINRRFRCLDLDLNGPQPVLVEQPAGAFLMIRRDAWEQLGGFDERFYPLWFEDVDFCFRLKEAGLRVFYVPDAIAAHSGAHSIRKMPLEFREIYWYGNLLEYVSKHYPPFQRRLVCCAVMAGSVLRVMGGVFSLKVWQALAVYWKVVQIASRHFGLREPGGESLS